MKMLRVVPYICALVISISNGVAAQGSDPVAKAYASKYGLSYDEALTRLKKIDGNAISGLDESLSSNPDYSGLKILHAPELKVVVMGKGNASELAAKAKLDIPVEGHNVPRSRKELTGAAGAAANALQNLRVAYEYDVEPETGKVSFFVVDDSKALPALAAIVKNFPFITISKVQYLGQTVATFIGGQQVIGSSSCTSGFTVYNNSNSSQRGVITAAHCGASNVRVNGVTFSSPVRRLYGGDNDQMWFTAAGHTWTNTIYIGQTSPSTIAIRGTFDPPVGQPLCKYGLTTGQTCGEVMSTTTAVYNPDNGTQGVYYRVSNYTANQYMTREGDSGGPVFGTEGAAFGLVQSRGGSQYPYDMYFMPAKRFPNIGVTVLTSP